MPASKTTLAQELINLGHGHKAADALKLIDQGATPEEVFAFLEPQLARAVLTLRWVEQNLGEDPKNELGK